MRQDGQERVVRQTTDAVRFAHAQAQAKAQLAQDLVAGLHAMRAIQAMRAIDVDEHERDGVGVAPRFRGLDPKTLEDAPSARGAGRGVNRRSMLEPHPLQLDGLPCSQQFGDGAPQLARQSQRVVRLGRDAFHLGPVGSREERDGAQLDLAVARAARSSEHREDCRQGHRHQSRHQVCRARPRETERQRAGRQPSKPLRSAAVRISHRRRDGGDREKRRAAGREAQCQQQNRRTQKTHGGCQLDPAKDESGGHQSRATSGDAHGGHHLRREQCQRSGGDPERQHRRREAS